MGRDENSDKDFIVDLTLATLLNNPRFLPQRLSGHFTG
jgi:hypothetical protein